jgi:hypothetical protein
MMAEHYLKTSVEHLFDAEMGRNNFKQLLSTKAVPWRQLTAQPR